MFKRIMNALSGDKNRVQPIQHHNRLHDVLDSHDIEKYKSNLKIINYQDLLDFIVQDEIYKIDQDKLESKSSSIMIEHHNEEEYRIIEDNEEDQYPITIEEDYRFILVKKAKPKPTLVMPTKILKQLQEPSDHRSPEAPPDKPSSS